MSAGKPCPDCRKAIGPRMVACWPCYRKRHGGLHPRNTCDACDREDDGPHDSDCPVAPPFAARLVTATTERALREVTDAEVERFLAIAVPHLAICAPRTRDNCRSALTDFLERRMAEGRAS